MKKLLKVHIIILLALCLNLSTIFSQDLAKIDSLETLISKSSNDTGKVILLQKIFWEYRRWNTEKALEYAEYSKQISESIDYYKGIANSCYQIGVIKKVLGNYIESSEILEIGLTYFEELRDTIGIIGCYTDLGDICKKQNDYDKALSYFDNARKLSLLIGDKEKLSRIYSILGGIFATQKQYEKSLEYHVKSLNLNSEKDFKLGMSANYNNIGNVYNKLEQYDEAKENYLKALQIKLEIKDEAGIASIYNNLGLISASQLYISEAIEYHNRALKKYHEQNNISGMAMCYINLAIVEMLAKNPDKAMEYALTGTKIAESHKFKEIQAEAYSILSSAYEDQKHFEKALYFHKLYKEYNDSLLNIDVISRISEMESRSEVDKKEKEIILLNTEKEKQDLKIEKQELQRNMLIWLILLVFVTLIILIWGYRNNEKLNKKLADLNLIKSRFFANISHEFRTPLTLLLGPIEQLLEDQKLKEKEMVGLMHRNATRLLFLNNQLLELSKLESGKLKLEITNSDLIMILKGMVMSFQSLAEKHVIDLKSQFPDYEIMAYIDQDKLEKIVYNLLSNAIKFTPENESVLFELILITDKSAIQIPPKFKKLNGRIICISVSDRGPGISKEHLPNIFDRFYQVDANLNRKFEGTGLGLSLSKELVELHHGIIQVESDIGIGTIFKVYLPIDRQDYSDNEIVEEKDKKSTLSKLGFLKPYYKSPLKEEYEDDEELQIFSSENSIHILIVEDNSDMRSYIRDCFDENYFVIEAANGKIGFEAACKNMPDIIITDLMMPEMDGIELCKKLKADERTSHIPVILLTALSAVEDRIKGLETGADDYVAKPFNHQELQTRVQNLVDQRKKLIERFSKKFKIEASDIAVTPVDVRFIDKLISRIEKNIADPDFNLDQLTDEINLSRSQLHRKLKALTGQSATEFIRTIRLKRAARLMDQNHGSISEIIYAVGFSNLSYFTKCFQKQFNMAPRDYIKKFSHKT